jgi:hypothetical protein
MMQLHSSPLDSVFSSFISSITSSGVICSPFIGREPIDNLVRAMRQKQIEQQVELLVVTDISLNNLLLGATDVDALSELYGAIPGTRLVYLPGVHAKVYVADRRLAVVGSANFTTGGVSRNLEYVACIRSPRHIRQIRSDVEGYASLGGIVEPPQLHAIREVSKRLRDAVRHEQAEINQKLRDASDVLRQQAEERLVRIRVAGSTINSIFSRTIEYVLGNGPLTTEQLHERIQDIHPDLCDDTVDRVIDGVRYGKLWKHQVRTAQQHLKRRDRVAFDEESATWRLIPDGKHR